MSDVRATRCPRCNAKNNFHQGQPKVCRRCGFRKHRAKRPAPEPVAAQPVHEPAPEPVAHEEHDEPDDEDGFEEEDLAVLDKDTLADTGFTLALSDRRLRMERAGNNGFSRMLDLRSVVGASVERSLSGPLVAVGVLLLFMGLGAGAAGIAFDAGVVLTAVVALVLLLLGIVAIVLAPRRQLEIHASRGDLDIRVVGKRGQQDELEAFAVAVLDQKDVVVGFA